MLLIARGDTDALALQLFVDDEVKLVDVERDKDGETVADPEIVLVGLPVEVALKLREVEIVDVRVVSAVGVFVADAENECDSEDDAEDVREADVLDESDELVVAETDRVPVGSCVRDIESEAD